MPARDGTGPLGRGPRTGGGRGRCADGDLPPGRGRGGRCGWGRGRGTGYGRRGGAAQATDTTSRLMERIRDLEARLDARGAEPRRDA